MISGKPLTGLWVWLIKNYYQKFAPTEQKLKTYALIIITLYSINSNCLAQTNIETTDSTNTNKWQPFKVQEVKYTTGINNEVYQIIDTSLQNFQVYDPALQAQFHYRTTGNIGLAAYPIFFQPYNNFGFDF
jgi:hypothetical protein